MVKSKVKDKNIDSIGFISIAFKFFDALGVVSFNTVTKASGSIFRRKTFPLILFVLGFGNLALCVLGEIIYFVKTFGLIQNFVEETSLVLCIGYIFLSFAKAATIEWERPKLTALIVDLHRLFPKTKTDQDDYNARSYYDRTKSLTMRYSIFQTGMICLFNFYPLIETIKGYVRDKSWQLDFPYRIWYPFNAYAPGVFELNYFSQIHAAYTATSMIIATDVLLCGCVIQICMHFDHLKKTIGLLNPTKQTAAVEFYKLQQCIKRHNEIIRMSVQLDNIFGGCILFNFVSSSIIICVLGFLVATAGRSPEIAKYIFTLCSCVLQIFTICMLGDKLIEVSSAVGDCAYQSNWFDGEERYKKALVNIIQRSSRPQYLRAYKFSVASMINFSKVLSTSWQFFALLHSFYEE